MFKVSLHKRAAKYYESLDNNTARRINTVVEDLSRNPFEGSHIKRLHGKQAGKYRYSVGSIRIVYRVKDDNVLIEAIGPRGDIYK